jgi:peroxiredoxin
MLPLGTEAPCFSLPDVVSGKTISLTDLPPGRGLLIAFICNHCPYVKHVREELSRMGRDFAASGVATIAICSNSVESHPEDAPDQMAMEARRAGYSFPYLFDATQVVAKSYRAACTPDFFLFDSARKLVYRGQMDDSRPGNGLPVTGADLRAAVLALLENRPVNPIQKPGMGCNIKWKPGNEPDYFR